MSIGCIASPEDGYRLGYEVGRAVVFNRLGQIILLQRPFGHPRKGGLYELPGGKMDPTDENLKAAIMREVREETGAHISLHATDPVVYDRRMEDNGLIHRTTTVVADIEDVEGDVLRYDPSEHQRLVQVAPEMALQYRLEESCRYTLEVLGLMALK